MSAKTRGGIAYEERGAGFPFIALHGYSLDRRMSIGAFEPLFDASGRGAGPGGRAYRRLYPDLPFMGESTDEPGGAGHDGILALMADFVRETVPDGPFLLAGESYGGYLARGLSRVFGARVAGMLLLCPSIVASTGSRDLDPRDEEAVREAPGWREAAKAAGATEADIADYERHAMARSLAGFERTRAEVLAGIRVARLGAADRFFAGAEAFGFDSLGKSGTPAAGAAFDPAFSKPACFFLGRQDLSVGWRDPLRLSDRYPRASFHIVDAAGHNAQIDQPTLFASAFRAWIGACEKERG